MKRNEVDRSKLSPMMKHYVELKDKYEDTIILYRLGDFYEMFFDDAEVVAHSLELTLTGKSKKRYNRSNIFRYYYKCQFIKWKRK